MFGALIYMAQRPGHEENWSETIWRALKCDVGGERRKQNGHRKKLMKFMNV